MRLSLLLLTLTLLLSACGYRLTKEEQGVLSAHDSIYIHLFQNNTYEPGIETDITDAILQVTNRYGTLHPVDSSSDGDLSLTGSLLKYKVASISYDAADDVREYRLEVVVSVRLERQSDGKVLWKGEIARDAEFLTDSDRSLLKQRELDAFNRLGIRIAEDLYSAIQMAF